MRLFQVAALAGLGLFLATQAKPADDLHGQSGRARIGGFAQLDSIVQPKVQQPGPGGTIDFEISDSTYEDAAFISRGDGEFAGLVNVGTSDGQVTRGGICFQNLGAPASNFEFWINFYRVSSGRPGRLLESYRVRLSSLQAGFSCRGVEFDRAVTVPERFFISASWNFDQHPDVLMPIDLNGRRQVLFARILNDTSWLEPQAAFGGDIRGFAIGGHWEPPSNGGDGGEPDDFLQDDHTGPCQGLCLRNRRFEITATYELGSGESGSMGTRLVTDDTGALFFKNSNNVEVFVKILEGCGINENYWVFAAGLTNQGVTLKVRDSVEGKSRVYSNPLGTVYSTITGTTPPTGSFATCP